MGRAPCLYPLSPYGGTEDVQSWGSFFFVAEVAWLLGIIASAVSVFLLSGHVSTFSLAYIAGLCTGCFLLIVLITVKFGCCFAEDLGLKDYLGWKTPGWNWIEKRYPFLWILVDILLWVLFALLWGLGFTAIFFEENNNAMSIFLKVSLSLSGYGFGRPDVAIIINLLIILMLFVFPLVMLVFTLMEAVEEYLGDSPLCTWISSFWKKEKPLWPETGQIEGSENTAAKEPVILLPWIDSPPTQTQGMRFARGMRWSTEDSTLSDEKECAICLEVFIEGDEVRKLQCGHIHHTQCVDKWLKHSATCPLCKKQVTLEEGHPLQRSLSV